MSPPFFYADVILALLTGKERYAVPHRAAVRDMPAALRQLDAIAAADPAASESDGWQSLIARADKMAYAAKAAGRGQHAMEAVATIHSV